VTGIGLIEEGNVGSVDHDLGLGELPIPAGMIEVAVRVQNDVDPLSADSIRILLSATSTK